MKKAVLLVSVLLFAAAAASPAGMRSGYLPF